LSWENFHQLVAPVNNQVNHTFIQHAPPRPYQTFVPHESYTEEQQKWLNTAHRHDQFIYSRVGPGAVLEPLPKRILDLPPPAIINKTPESSSTQPHAYHISFSDGDALPIVSTRNCNTVEYSTTVQQEKTTTIKIPEETSSFQTTAEEIQKENNINQKITHPLPSSIFEILQSTFKSTIENNYPLQVANRISQRLFSLSLLPTNNHNSSQQDSDTSVK
jgi:hypothetical protein